LVVARAIEALPEKGRADAGARIISRLIDLLSQVSDGINREVDLPIEPARVLSATASGETHASGSTGSKQAAAPR
jgi:hypothetical protein